MAYHCKCERLSALHVLNCERVSNTNRNERGVPSVFPVCLCTGHHWKDRLQVGGGLPLGKRDGAWAGRETQSALLTLSYCLPFLNHMQASLYQLLNKSLPLDRSSKGPGLPLPPSSREAPLQTPHWGNVRIRTFTTTQWSKATPTACQWETMRGAGTPKPIQQEQGDPTLSVNRDQVRKLDFYLHLILLPLPEWYQRKSARTDIR